MATDNIASSVMQTLGGGSGIDIVKLARDLTDVEKLPAEEKINASQEATEAKISALAVLKFNVQALVDQFNALNDASELATPIATSSDSSVVSVTSTDGSAQSGLSNFHVDALATAQRNLSDVYSSTSQAINGGGAVSRLTSLSRRQLEPPPQLQLLQATTPRREWSAPSTHQGSGLPLRL